jgi:putative PIN family toxin of toxin-antitoxin system
MPRSSLRVVIDTNVLLRGLASRTSNSASVLRAAERRLFVVLLSKPIVDEYRTVLLNPNVIKKFPRITPALFDATIQHLRFIGDYERTPSAQFEFARDPRDEKFIESAISQSATHILTYDKDLLSLPGNQDEAGKRFRQRLAGVGVMDGGVFLDEYANEFKLK